MKTEPEGGTEIKRQTLIDSEERVDPEYFH